MGDGESFGWKGKTLIQYYSVMTHGFVRFTNTCFFRTSQDLVTEGKLFNRPALHSANSLSWLNV